MSIKKFLLNGSEEQVSKSALGSDVVDELFPRIIATFTGYSTENTTPQCDVAFNQLAEAIENGSHAILRHRSLGPSDSGTIREVYLSPVLTFDNDGVLVRIQGTHVDSSALFEDPAGISPDYTYIDYTNESLAVYRSSVSNSEG